MLASTFNRNDDDSLLYENYNLSSATDLLSMIKEMIMKFT